jgi:hypothetical protein
MKVRAALVAALIGVSLAANAGTVDPNEPPRTPADGAPEAGLTGGQIAGIVITVGVLGALAAGGGGGGGGTTGSTGSTGSTN